MNRAILIVICDFLVSAMLSMMTGMVPAHTGGTGVGLDEETTRVLLNELEASRLELERMRDRLREAVRRAGGATPEQERRLRELALRIVAGQRDAELLRKGTDPNKLARLSAAELQKRLEAELRRRMSAELELKGQREDRSEIEKELREMRRDFAATGHAIAELAKRETESGQEVSRAQVELRRAETELAAARAELEAGRREIKQRNADLADVRETLREVNAKLGQTAAEAGTLRQTLAYTTGKLDSAEREAAESRDRLDHLRREHSVTILERDDARRRQTELEQVVRNTVNELSQARKAAEESRVRSAEAVGRLTAVSEELKEAKRRLGDHVLQYYGNGAVKLGVIIHEDGLVTERHGGGIQYLPLVELNGRQFIVGFLRQFIGDMRVPLHFSRVRQFGLFASIPGNMASRPVQLSGPVLLNAREPRMAALETRVDGRTPFKALTLKELRERGLHGLYLFKAGSFGRENAELDGRCSLDVSEGIPYVFIRNSGSRSELRAEPGDILLTREGDYAGIVVNVDSRGFGRGDEARAFVFPDGDAWRNARTIPLNKPAGAKYYDDFAAAVRAARDAAKL